MSGKGYQKYSIGTVIAVITIIALSVATIVTALSNVNFGNTGNVHINTIGPIQIYEDEALTTSLTTIGWGKLNPTSTAQHTFWIFNVGETPLQLSSNTSSWYPSDLNNNATLTLDVEGTTIGVGANAKLAATVTLSINGYYNETSFSFVVTIYGSPT